MEENKTFTCPECGATHDRGFFQTPGIYRCLKCGYTGPEEIPDGTISKWQLCDDPLLRRRVGKTGEELGELTAVVTRIDIQGLEEIDPSSGETNRQRFLKEMADVSAQIKCNLQMLPWTDEELEAFTRRELKKMLLMHTWEAQYFPPGEDEEHDAINELSEVTRWSYDQIRSYYQKVCGGNLELLKGHVLARSKAGLSLW